MKKDDIERKIESEMTQKFKAASGNPKLAIHLAAVAGAFICALLPIGIDVWGLRTCEVIMIICIASLYGEKLTKAAARGILASSFAQLVGEAAALTALEAADVANLLNPCLAYGIKASIAVSLIEAIGHEALKHYDKKYKAGEKRKLTAFDAICVAGGAADVARITKVVGNFITGSQLSPSLQSTTTNESASLVSENAKMISFCGDNLLREIHELEVKIENQKGKVEMIRKWIESDIRFGRDTTLNENKLKYALTELGRLEKELLRLAKR